MRSIDLNADTGEADSADWQAVEAQVMSYISSANIACGGHAGDAESMKRTIELARLSGVNIGAHPAYPDRENFGRKSHKLNQDISARSLRESLTAQISALIDISTEQDMNVTYVKPHGALYNDAVFDPELAELIIATVKEINPELWIMGAPQSELTQAAERQNMSFVAEGFVDRRYTDDGHLLSRAKAGAVLEDQSERTQQALSLWRGNAVITDQRHELVLTVQTLCLHSDSPGAAQTAQAIRGSLETAGATIKAFNDG